MASLDESIDQMEQSVPALAAEAVKEAFEASLRAGNKIVVLSEDALYEVSSNSSKVKIKTIPARVRIGKGTKFKIY